VDLTPALVLSMWSAGIGVASATVISWRIVGPGFARLAAAVLVLVAFAAAAAGNGVAGWGAVAAGCGALLFARRHMTVVVLLIAAGGLLVIAALEDSPLLPVLTGALLLGAVSAEMILGHWYLVDPQLPRWALHVLALGAGVGLVAELAYVGAEGAFSWAEADTVIGWAFISLVVLSALLIIGVSLSLRELSYTGVMSATGLSYLAVLTVFGVAVLGRTLVV
jgi:hypothetical protein